MPPWTLWNETDDPPTRIRKVTEDWDRRIKRWQDKATILRPIPRDQYQLKHYVITFQTVTTNYPDWQGSRIRTGPHRVMEISARCEDEARDKFKALNQQDALLTIRRSIT